MIETMTYEQLEKVHLKAFKKWKKTHDGQPFTTLPAVCVQYLDHPQTVKEQQDHDDAIWEHMIST